MMTRSKASSGVEDLLHVSASHELGKCRARGCGEDPEARTVPGHGGVRPEELRVVLGLLVPGQVRDRRRRLHVEVGGNLAPLECEVDDERLVGPVRRGGGGNVHRERRRPDSALRAEERHRAACRLAGRGSRERRAIPGPLEAEQQGLDPGLQLPGVEGPGHDVVRPGLEEADALLDVVKGADAQDRDRRERRRGTDLAAELRRGVRAGKDVDDDETVLGGPGEGLGAVRDGGDVVTDAGENSRNEVAGAGIGLNEKDGA